ncbi:WD40/YVTN/BNR-like repeat-containing protein [Amycolatopsis anabasis]|uniref:WD40/YVTN/BNR-like repeat-containing protein n=1 Tax=Amycolatopsis anabasis TaxID=1840409 RepID=UPI00131E9F22|nr:oxidoreductase [Amycolatopsis anabasis]
MRRWTRFSLVLAAALLAVAVPVSAEAAGLVWRPVPTGVDARLRGLDAVDRDTAWASGGKGTVLRTVDGGRTWRQVAPPDTAGLDFRDVEAFDADHAVVLSIGPGAASRIYTTADGGAHWRLAFRNTDERAFYDCLTFFDHRRGLAMGDPVDGKFTLLSTVDGGGSWRPVPADGMPPALPGEAGFAASGQCVQAGSNGRDAWIATGGGERARVLRSADGGRHWAAVDTPLLSSQSAGVFAVSFRDSRHGLAIGGDYAKPDAVVPGLAISSDGGRSWRTPPHAPAGYRSGLAWLGPVALAVGPTGSDLSLDGGRHWRSFDTGSFDTVSCARLACWAAGEHGRAAKLGH